MIEDTVKFRTFINIWMDTYEHIVAFSQNYYVTYQMDNDLTIGEKEVNFFKAMNSYPPNGPGCGLKLFRGNEDMTSFAPIKLVNGTLIKPNPCY